MIKTIISKSGYSTQRNNAFKWWNTLSVSDKHKLTKGAMLTNEQVCATTIHLFYIDEMNVQRIYEPGSKAPYEVKQGEIDIIKF